MARDVKPVAAAAGMRASAGASRRSTGTPSRASSGATSRTQNAAGQAAFGPQSSSEQCSHGGMSAITLTGPDAAIGSALNAAAGWTAATDATTTTRTAASIFRNRCTAGP